LKRLNSHKLTDSEIGVIMPVFDISQTINDTIAVWPGDQKFRTRWGMRIMRGDSCNVSAVTMSVHTGTHLDAPYHFSDAGLGIASVPLHTGLGRARVFAVPAELNFITGAFLEHLDWCGVERALFRTRSSDSGDNRFHRDFVCLTEDGARYLADRALLLAGTDAPSIDAFTSKTFACHKILAGCGIAILEGLRLAHVTPGDYELICLPLKFSGLDGSPVRAVLRSLP
jgi:arylformamidase